MNFCLEVISRPEVKPHVFFWGTLGCSTIVSSTIEGRFRPFLYYIKESKYELINHNYGHNFVPYFDF